VSQCVDSPPQSHQPLQDSNSPFALHRRGKAFYCACVHVCLPECVSVLSVCVAVLSVCMAVLSVCLAVLSVCVCLSVCL